ncbi:MAG: hypothetical protein HQL46_06705 [Gammaproteobacteria bacterium]|nr:hypothetical protein [Gammaproteobacteria bacterium]
MELTLETNEDDILLPVDERESMLKRINPVDNEEILKFDESQQQQIKAELVKLIIYSNYIQLDMQDNKHEKHVRINHQKRQTLIKEASPIVKKYFFMMNIYAVEPWLAWRTFMDLLHKEISEEYFRIEKNKTTNNPFLVRIEGVSSEPSSEKNQIDRLTASMIEEYIFHFNLLELSNFLIKARKLITGTFWENEYDL